MLLLYMFPSVNHLFFYLFLSCFYEFFHLWNTRHQKTLRLPHATLSCRKQAQDYLKDDAALLEWVQANATRHHEFYHKFRYIYVKIVCSGNNVIL